jgi:hypothetical protein
MSENLVLAVPSRRQIRDELEAAVIRDLRGPVNGPEEEIDEASVRDRYLVGMLAPRRQVLTPEEFDELAVGGEGPPEEGTVDVNAPQATTMFPSSFGLTFCVDGGAPPSRSRPAGATTTAWTARSSKRRGTRRRSGSAARSRAPPTRSL